MKKKILSLLLSVTLIFSMFSLTAFAQETTKTEQWITKNSSAFHLHVTLHNSDYVETDSYDVYQKNNKVSIKNVTLFGNFKVDFIYNGDDAIFCPSGFPFIHFLVDDDFINLDDTLESDDIGENTIFVKSYEQKINSTVYYIEEFIYEDPEIDDSEAVHKYCFLGDELKLVITKSKEQIIHTEIVSTDVNDNVFKLPFFSINLTPLFKMLQLIFSDY